MKKLLLAIFAIAITFGFTVTDASAQMSKDTNMMKSDNHMVVGAAMFKTVAGGMLTATMDGSVLVLTDEKGGMSRVTIADVKQSNGVIHVIDTVLMPN